MSKVRIIMKALKNELLLLLLLVSFLNNFLWVFGLFGHNQTRHLLRLFTRSRASEIRTMNLVTVLASLTSTVICHEMVTTGSIELMRPWAPVEMELSVSVLTGRGSVMFSWSMKAR